jgi:TRAP-type C4-dicarboxylate transport system substrate-binding protein
MSAFTLRAGGYQGEASVHTSGLRALGRALARLSGGDVILEIVPDVTRSGRNATDLLADVESGQTDLCYFASSYLAVRRPSLSLFDIPFSTIDRHDAFRRLDGDLRRRIAADVAAGTGFELLAFWDNGFRHLSNRMHAIRSPSDCEGLTIRTLPSALHGEVFSAFGFTPMMIDVKNLAAAVRSGAVDAQENPLGNTVNFGLHMSHRHHTLTSHFFGVALLLLSRARAAAWPVSVRTVLSDAVAIATDAQRACAVEEDRRCLAILRDAGAEILCGDTVDIAAFRAAVAPIRSREIGRLDPALARGYGLC